MRTMYGYMKCGTCRKALKWFEAAGVEVAFVDITQTPPTKKLLGAILKRGGYPMAKLFNTSGGQYRELKIKDKLAGMTEKEAIDLLAGNGMLCKRPIVTDGKGRHTVGFDEAKFEEVWG